MAQFDVFLLGSGSIVVDCQSDQIWQLDSRVVAPLVPIEQDLTPISRLNPVFQLHNGRYIMMTHLLSAIHASQMRTKIGSLDGEYLRVEAALDTLTGSY